MTEQELLLPEALAPLVKHTIFAGHIHYWPEVESTNSLAVQAAALGSRETEEGEGTVFLADAQTAGRGRGGHSWHSEHGSDIYASFPVRPRSAPPQGLRLSSDARSGYCWKTYAVPRPTSGGNLSLLWTSLPAVLPIFTESACKCWKKIATTA